jgi:outer membrane protein OmpA-like peptidoglycan-associated protein
MMRTTQVTARQNRSARYPQPALAYGSTAGKYTQRRLAHMQSAHGNQGLQRLLLGGVLQRKLIINQPGDVYEQEADRVADAMTSVSPTASIPLPTRRIGSAASVQCCACGQPEEVLRSSAAPRQTGTAPPIVHEALDSPGRPLDVATRSFLEPRFGHDFSGVRVHDGVAAAESASAVNALAYTVGQDIVFGSKQYAPSTRTGQHLLAHELAHVLQQRGEHASYHVQTAASGPAMLQRQSPPPQAQPAQTQPAPIDRERDFRVRPTVDPSSIDLGLDFILGRHVFSADVGVDTPLGLLNERLFGTAHPTIGLAYRNRCNQTLQNALVELREAQQNGRFLDFSRNFWDVTGSVGLRVGDIRFQPGVTVGFNGNRFDSVAFTIGLAAASTRVPQECRDIITNPPPRPPTSGSHPPTSTPGGGTERQHQETPQPPPAAQPARAAPETIYFFYDTTIVRPESNSSLERVLLLLRVVPSLGVQLTGHTSLEGTDEYNLRLSRRRASSIQQYLVAHGIAASRIMAMGLGESAPAVPEPAVGRFSLNPRVEAIRNQNRRVEVMFWDPNGRFAPESPGFRLSIPQSGPFRLTE